MLPLLLLTIEDPEKRKAYEDAYVRLKKYLLTIAFKILKDPELAEDSVHDAFAYVLDTDKLPADAQGAKALLATVTKHIAVDMARKRDHFSEDESTESQFGYIVPQDASLLAMTIDALPENYKEVLILHYEYGYKASELSRLLGISAAAVLKRLERARTMLQKNYLEPDK